MARQLTITLDDEVAARLEEEATRTGTPSTELVTQAVELALSRVEINGPFASSKPGAGSFDCIARVLDELEGLTLYSADADFRRFRGLRVINPLLE